MSGIQVSGIDLSAIFAARGSVTAAPNTGIVAAGSDLSALFLPLASGSPVAATGILKNGADLNTIFGAAAGTLPINGQLFAATPTPAGSTSAATLQFITNNSAFSVYDPVVGTLASGSIPVGAAKCQVTLTLTAGTPATITNPLSSMTTLTASNATVEVNNVLVGSGPAIKSTYTVNIQYQNGAGTVISTTNCTFRVNTNSI